MPLGLAVMATTMRKTGIDVMGDMPWGTHVCLFYETKQDLLDTLVAYFKAGLEANEFCIWAVSEPATVNDARKALRKGIPDFDKRLSAGDIEILPGKDWYLEGEKFDLQRVSAGWSEKLQHSLSTGHAGMRVSGNAFWMKTKHWKEFCEYEHELDQSLAGQPMLVLCTYPLTASRAVDVLDVARAHQVTIARRNNSWEVVETPELKQAKQQIKELNEELEQRVIERTKELAALNEELRNQIAECARIERELRLSEMHLAEAQRLTRTSSWNWNTATGELRWSAEHFHIFGFDPRNGHPSFSRAMDRIHPEDLPGLEQALQRAISAKADFNQSFRVVLPDGSVKYCQSLGHTTVNERGEVEYLGTVMDVTERRRGEEALQNAQADLARAARLTSMGELAASIAHEINQPLAAVVSNADAALRWLAKDAPDLLRARDSVTRIIRDANRASDVIKRVRALLSKDEPEYAAFDINEAIREVLALLRGTLRSHHISLKTELFPGLPLVRGDRIQLQQVVMNLVINGVEAMAPVTGGPREIAIKSGVAGAGNVMVAAEDTGPGLDPAATERIFDPFYTTKPAGMGMGLSISRTIVEAHGGRIWASPRVPHGTIIQFNLPISGGKRP
jgi:signal transduction histidine kinase